MPEISRALPGIDVTRRTVFRRLIMTRGKDRKVPVDAAAVIDADGNARGRGGDGTPLPIDDTQAPWLSGQPKMPRDQLGNVAAIDAALGEGQRPGLLALGVFVVFGKPSAEMQGIVGECTHIGGAHIQQMPWLRRRVGHAPADRRPLLDQRDADCLIVVAQEMAGEKHAARAAANDNDVLAAFRRQRNLNTSAQAASWINIRACHAPPTDGEEPRSRHRRPRAYCRARRRDARSSRDRSGAGSAGRNGGRHARRCLPY